MKKLLFFIAIVAIVTNNSNAQSVGSSAPDFTVNLLGGGDYTLSDMQGKVVFLFFFGNTCPSCIAVGPSIKQEIIDTYSSNENFAAIGLDSWDGSASSVNSFKSQTGLDIDLGLDASSIVESYGSTYDRVLVVDKEGILRHKSSKAASSDISTAKSIITEYLSADTPADTTDTTDTGGTTSTEEISNSSDISLYPNPTSDFISVKIQNENSGLVDLKLIDATGRLVKSENYNFVGGSTSLSLDVNEIPRGVYFLSINYNNNRYISKVSVSR